MIGNLLIVIHTIGLVGELKPFPQREAPVAGVNHAGQIAGHPVTGLEFACGVGIVADECVVGSGLEVLVDLVGCAEGELIPFNARERVLGA